MSFADILSGLESDSRRRLAAKIPSWEGLDISVPASLNLQQCSSEAAARHKAALLPGGARVADLTGGLGVDSWAFSLSSPAVWYNEREAALLDAVRHNFALLGVSNAVFNNFNIDSSDSAWQVSLREFKPDVIYLDPARRGAGGEKVFLLEDCSPDVVSLMPLLLSLAPRVMIKVSPMADLTMLKRRLAGYLYELHVVGLNGECKEILCLCKTGVSVEPTVTLWEDGFYWGCPSSGCQRELLFVPSAALTKSGLGPGMGLMPYNEELPHFGKFWEVLENLPFASSVLKSVGARYPVAEVTARGVHLSSSELQKKMKTKPGGSVHIFACLLSGDRRLLICKQVL